MKKTTVTYSLNGRHGDIQIRALLGDVTNGGDAWTLATAILRKWEPGNPNGYFILGISKMRARYDVLGENFCLGSSKLRNQYQQFEGSHLGEDMILGKQCFTRRIIGDKLR